MYSQRLKKYLPWMEEVKTLITRLSNTTVHQHFFYFSSTSNYNLLIFHLSTFSVQLIMYIVKADLSLPSPFLLSFLHFITFSNVTEILGLSLGSSRDFWYFQSFSSMTENAKKRDTHVIRYSIPYMWVILELTFADVSGICPVFVKWHEPVLILFFDAICNRKYLHSVT